MKTLSRTFSKMPAQSLGKAMMVMCAVMTVVCPACVEEKTFEDELASAFRDCGLLSSGKTTNFWIIFSVRSECDYRCFMKWGCVSLLPRACGTEIPSYVMDCIIDCIPEPVDCGDGTTVPGVQVCDLVTDCENGADESGCYPQFHCANGSEVIPAILVCNDFDNCSDGSDEADCSPSDFFQCADGNGSVLRYWVCNESLDCDDGSDESGCAEYICD